MTKLQFFTHVIGKTNVILILINLFTQLSVRLLSYSVVNEHLQRRLSLGGH